ncbi:hypothetical protein H8356DRAFT_940879 [Neocallimastix lanati (nom. inval.)]|uniref:SPEF2 C-terminal domain-containing protein n=1 Tax=Neocallimastix californiae TaxID=1754190 RepID=A0A1Y2A7K3_9FUNG|nr:hypothetical protein H8356DRAFT_940879 [Neocallimastix sp. JGI-2020a]ORY18454.1 hypothetical protein LY90DRAFT_517427 [Neocallimastix californiae]|eukprot:ORY18454.1 hypothetical protein LY90DRAFT_517427 [Neocallimastix californiae]
MYDSLNQIIDNLTEITKASDNLFEMMELPKVPITISIIGKRYSGKMTLANHLGSMYNLVVLSLEDMIKDAVRATTTDIKPSNEDTNENNITFKAKKGTLTRAQIYSEIQTKISEGGYPGDELLVQLVIDSINRVNTNAKYPDCKGGWVLVNFPQNREQAALLEKELTGYEEPKKAKQSLQKRKSLSNIKIPIPSKKASATIERGFETKEGKLKSGLDLVLLMNADDEAVLKRKTGSKIDTFTGKMYHLEYNPPPENEPEIFERLVPFTDEDDNVHNQNQNILADGFDGQVDSIKDFYNRFKNIYEIDGSKTLRENVESVQFWFNEMINEKEKEEEEKKLEESKGDLDLQKEKKKKEEQENLEKIHEESITDNDLEAYSTQEQNKNIPKDDDKKRNNRSRTLSTREKDLKHKNNSASTITIKTPKVAWASIEVNYIETLKFIFRSLRREQNTLTRYFYNTKVNFKKFLDRPNNKQNIVTAFKEEYNQIDNNLRCNDQAKEVLHQRTYDLRDKLWEICDKRKEEAEQERKEIIEDRWIEDHLKLVINIYVTIMQVESDYTIGINQLVHDYYIDPNGPIKFLINRINSIDKKQPGLTKSLKEINQTSETNKPDSHDSKNNGNNQNNTCNLLNLSSISGSLCNSVLLKESSEHNSFLQNSDGVPYERYIDDAYNLAYSRNEFKDVEVINKEEKDKDLQNTPTETKKEDDKEEIPKDYIDFIQLLQTAYHLNLERVQTKAKDHIENLKKKGTDVFNLLDEWITKRYQIEIKAVNELIILIEHAIEHEELLPDKLIFEDEDFKAKCDQFTNITDILPPSINPVEQLLSEKFTIAQLLNICKMFNECSNTGIISREEFINCFMKLTALSTDMEDLPDDYANNEANQINQITDLLDPFNTGYINWKKFIMNQAGVLPVPNIEYITNLKQLYKNLPSYQNGKIYNYGLYTDENCTEKETDISYPKELFKEIFEDLNITPEEKVSFKQVMEIAERNYPLLLTCPFYQLEVFNISLPLLRRLNSNKINIFKFDNN